MEIEIPPIETIEDEMYALGVPNTVSFQAYRMARHDLLEGKIDGWEVAEAALRYERMLSAR